MQPARRGHAEQLGERACLARCGNPLSGAGRVHGHSKEHRQLAHGAPLSPPVIIPATLRWAWTALQDPTLAVSSVHGDSPGKNT